MERIPVSPNFMLDEFIDEATYMRFGESARWFIDPKLIAIAQYLRTVTRQPIIINNWARGGQFNFSGFRPPSATIGAQLSQHRFGRALDLKFRNLNVAEAAMLVREHWFTLKLLGLTTMEDIQFTPSWLHLDCRHTGKDLLYIVTP